MDRIRIRGGHPLKGEIPISGAKNAALKLMAASLLTSEPLILANVPRLADVRAMAELLMTFGVSIQVNMSPGLGEGDTMRLQAREITSVFASYDMVRKMRASFQVLAPLLARAREAKVSLPGGCAIGARPVELHLTALQQMGAKIELSEGYVTAKAPEGLKGAEIVFPFQIDEGSNVFRPSPARYALLALVDMLAMVTAEQIGQPALEGMRRMKHHVSQARNNDPRLPLGD